MSEKTGFHTRNKHKERYDFPALIKVLPALKEFVFENQHGDLSIDFFNPLAVRTLNKALLKHFYGINYWSIPENYLCPPIPGRVDYIHHAADLLSKSKSDKNIKCLDIGTGANCIYPLLGHKEYGWSFVGADIDRVAVKTAKRIVRMNDLENFIEIRTQKNPENIFEGIIKADERFHITICNPPFHSSAEEAKDATERKLKNLSAKEADTVLNFGGQSHELWSKGGEEKFIRRMIAESQKISEACLWFTTLVSKNSTLDSVKPLLQKMKPEEIKIIPMNHGNKSSRILAWRFISQLG